MVKFLNKILLFIIFVISFSACTTTSKTISPRQQNIQLKQGQKYFNEGYYKRAMRQLLPVAIEGNAQAEYAVGYMYYYGYGVTQDTDIAALWIERAADKHYLPAVKAQEMISRNRIN